MTEPAYTLKQLARAPNVVRAAVIEYERRITDLEAENARLRRSGANVSGLLIDAVGTGGEAIIEIERERDGYKALAERRGEALKQIGAKLDGDNIDEGTWQVQVNRCHPIIDAALAATID